MSKRLWPLVAGLLCAPSLAFGQATDYSAGKSPPQLFASDCSACHSSSRGLSRGRDAGSIARFLTQHYTTRQESAAALAAFLAGPGNAGPEPRSRQHPAGLRNRPPGVPPAPVGTEPATNPAEAAPRRPPRAIAVIPPEGRPEPRGTPGARERVEATKAAEDALRSKVRAYATTGEAARPIEPPPNVQAAQPLPTQPVQPAQPAPPSGATITVGPAPAVPTPAPAPGTPSDSERPAAPPPG